jgi:hypothetical protein
MAGCAETTRFESDQIAPCDRIHHLEVRLLKLG